MTGEDSLRVSADRDVCVVSSLCVYRVPEVFDQDEEGRVKVVDRTPPAELATEVRRAAQGCPTRAIRIEDSGAEDRR
ncbi:ferredoxin [Amycolatopsis alba]|uniref:ferredoxin n=1 Tax=Amycolatopsis alba TaxID=76020 RepID=UPI001AE03122|nr:ferredoxin [Amycolatopsis alba]